MRLTALVLPPPWRIVACAPNPPYELRVFGRDIPGYSKPFLTGKTAVSVRYRTIFVPECAAMRLHPGYAGYAGWSLRTRTNVGRNSGLAYSAECFHFPKRRNTRSTARTLRIIRMRLTALHVTAQILRSGDKMRMIFHNHISIQCVTGLALFGNQFIPNITMFMLDGFILGK